MRYSLLSLLLFSLLATSPASPALSASTKPLAVNELAAKPWSYIGKVTVVGRVMAATPGKGFTMIDSGKCSTCTTQCVPDKATRKVPIAWKGSAPRLKDVLLVKGTLARTAKGFEFTADKVVKQ